MAKLSTAERSRLKKALVVIEGIVDSHETDCEPYDQIDRLSKLASEIKYEIHT